MKQCSKICVVLLTVFTLLIAFVNEVISTPTGLNNIPTADVVAERTIVFQQFTHFGHRQRPGHWLGFKMNPVLRNWEIGMDRRVGPDPSGANTFQAKFKLDMRDPLPDFGVGVANIVFTSHGRSISGQPFPYLVFTQDLKLFRFTAGVDFQHDNEGAFIGLDKTLFWGFTPRTDAIQVNNGRDFLGSLGFIWELPYNLAFEGWYSANTNRQNRDFWLLKIDYAIKF